MSEKTIIRTYSNLYGLPVARLTAEQDTYGHSDGAGEYCHTNATVKVVNTPYLSHIHKPYYESTQDGPHHGPIAEAWTRFSDEYNSREAVAVLTRYARIFHPLVPIIERTLQTGYSQGDWVELIGWIEPASSKPSASEAPYQTATREHAELLDHFNIMEAVSRNQFWTVALERAEPSFTPTGSDFGNYSIEWHDMGETISTLAMEEFDPWEELRAVGEYHHDIPNHDTTTDTTYEEN